MRMIRIMILRACEVQDKDGNEVFAEKAICPQCEHDQFMILVIRGHNHLQCTQCGTSYCQNGQCE